MADAWDVASPLIQRYESGGGQNIRNRQGSSAFGPWQILSSTWRDTAPGLGLDLATYPTAAAAPVPVQERVAQRLYETRGYQPWTVGNPKLAAHLSGRGDGPPEGEYGGATHVNIPAPPRQQAPLLTALLAGFDSGGQPTPTDSAPASADMPLLAALVGAPGATQAGGSAPGGSGEAGAPYDTVEPPPAAPNALATTPPLDVKPIAGPQPLLDKLLQPLVSADGGYIEPPGQGSTETPTNSDKLQQTPTQPPGAPPAQTGMGLLDNLLDQFRQATVEPMAREVPAAVGDIGRMLGGLGERAELAEQSAATGQPMPAPQIPVRPGVERLGDIATFATGGLMSPLSVPREAAAAAALPAREAAAATPRVLADVRGGPSKTFTTAKGSRYTVHDDGTTTRDKSFHPEHGAADQGLQPRSEATFYVSPADAVKLGEIQSQGGPGRIIAPLGDGRWGVKYTEGKDAGKFEKRTVITPASDQPQAGLTPVEIFKGGGRVHFGNEITATGDATAGPAAAAPAAGGQPPRQPPAGPPGGGGLFGDPPIPPPPAPPGRISAAAKQVREVARRAIRDMQIKAVPMAAGDDAGRAIAKDYANMERLARWRRSRWDSELRKLSPADQQAMWEAMDNASVAAQAHGFDAGLRYLRALPREQRKLLAEMEQHGIELWEQARDAGIVAENAERLPFYIMRGIVEVGEDGAISRIRPGGQAGGGMSGIDQFGTNISTMGPRSRTHLTAEETEGAARTRFGEGAEIVRNIRVLPMAYERFERAIAARRMINDLKDIGEASGKPTVVEGAEGLGFFTVDHPAFKTYRPRFVTDPDGKTVPLRDPSGKIVFDRVPLYIDRHFEGPLRAIARGQSGPLYQGAMALKAGAMATIMNSPAIHNLVEWGRALGSMPGRVATFKVYRVGAKVLADKKLMERAIRDGLVPIGERGYLQDIEGIASASDLKPGRGMLAKGLGMATDLVSEPAGQAVRRGIDKAGDFWHQKLLWDQVAKLQAGLYNEFARDLVRKGIDRNVASKMAAHFANRFAGAVPNEAMSEMARKSLNFLLFSRSFTTGNLGVMKDMLNGLPRDVRAQIGRDLSPVEKRAAGSLARRKAIGVVLADVAIAYATNAILQSAVSVMRGDNTLDDEAKGYVDRLGRVMGNAKESPLSVINPLNDLAALSPTSENEPGRENKVLIGHAADGTAVYLRSPVGKIGEEFAGWFTGPIAQFKNKEGTIARPLANVINNDKGFGQKVYNASPHSLGDAAANVGRILWEFMRSQTPEYQFRAGAKLMSGKGDWVDALQFGAPFLGGTISRGAPGGEAVGELYAARGEHEQKVKEALPQVKDLVQSGKSDKAGQMLEALGVPRGLRNYYLKVYADPKARLSKGAMRDFDKSATPEQKARMQRQLDRGPMGGKVIQRLPVEAPR